MINYYDEDLTDGLLEKILKHDLIDKSCCSLTAILDKIFGTKWRDTIKLGKTSKI